MIETGTSWEDSGYDCDHCGGEIVKRIDREAGQRDKVCLQCKKCGCQWTPTGAVQRVGSGRHCKRAQREKAGTRPTDFLLSPRVLIVLGILLLAAVARFGGFASLFMLLRLLLPLGVLALIGYYVVRFGREQEWW